MIGAIGATFALKLQGSDPARIVTPLLQAYIQCRQAQLYLSAAEDRQECRRCPAVGYILDDPSVFCASVNSVTVGDKDEVNYARMVVNNGFGGAQSSASLG